MRLALALVILTAGCVSAQKPQRLRPDAVLQQADELTRARRWDDASNVFAQAVRTHPESAEYKIRWGRLFLERYNPPEAAKLFQDVLENDPKNADALLGMALVAESSFEGKSADLAHEALKENPKLTEAQELLGRLALEDNDPALARKEADAALKLDSQSLIAESVHASADLLEHKPADEWLNRIASEHPRDGRGYETLGHFFEINRRYDDAVDYFRKAVDTEPGLDSARSQLGLTLMRLGREAEARKELELAYNNHFRDSTTVNSLTLMDSYSRLKTFRTGTTVLKLDKKEADVLRLYMEPEFERALATYQKKYEFKLPRPVQLEVYPDHPDFEVRVAGLPGIGGILGVTFEDVVAMDSPSARPPGDFHWGATMWHELSHVYVLTITKQRVPRWFTEGVAVHEESQVSPDWGDRITPDVLMAIKDKKLLPVAELDRGFIHPKYHGQVVISYYQAGKIIDYIGKQWGEHKILDMIHAFANTDSTVEVVQNQLGMKPEEFDRKFLAWLNAETKNDVEHLDAWQKHMKELNAAATRHSYDDVIAKAPEVVSEYPEFVEPGNAYQLLAQAYEAKGDRAAAAQQLQRYSEAGGRDPQALKNLATLLSGRTVIADGGNKGTITAIPNPAKTKESAQVLTRLIYINPLDDDLHKMLGELDLELRDTNGAIREYRALLAGNSPDQAAAHFGLARAYHEAHDDKQAKDELFNALEIAPGFKPAQKMLLEMNASD